MANAVMQEEQQNTTPETVSGSEANVEGTQGPSREQSATNVNQEKAIQTVLVDDSEADARYANFCRVSSTPEELIMDLGLNPNPYAQGEVTVSISQRTILNHYTAKRLLSALSMALQRHEQAFGNLETDVRRRIRTT